MRTDELIAALQAAGVFVTNTHVRVPNTPELHAESFFDKERLYQHRSLLRASCTALAERFADEDVTAVVGPGGKSRYMVKYMASLLAATPALAYKRRGKNGNVTGYVLARQHRGRLRGQRVLIVDDAIWTGATTIKLAALARIHGGDTAGMAVVANRGGFTSEEIEVPSLRAIITRKFDVFARDDCPRCYARVPIESSLCGVRPALPEAAE